MKILICAFVALISSYGFNTLAKDNPPLPGVKLIKGPHLYMASTEVSNINYKEFLYYIKKNDLIAYSSNYPDTIAWNTMDQFDPFVNYYFQHSSYNDYPVVNISKTQAEFYCIWLTKILNIGLKEGTYGDSEIDEVLVRLPSELEWEFAAMGGANENVNYPWGTNQLRIEDGKYQGMLRANFKRVKQQDRVSKWTNDETLVTTVVDAYWPNDFGLYNMAGNVSEMVAEDNISKGGSWNSTAFNLQIQERETYSGPNPQTGFRYLVEVIKFKPSVSTKREFKPRKLLKNMTSLSDSLFVAQTEVSNEEYMQFKKAIQNSESGKEYISNDENWSNFTEAPYMRHYSTSEIFSSYPAVNISHNQAERFCEYLTSRFNDHPKRKYNKVRFRLPTEKEWMLAATNSYQAAELPWNGSYFRNSRGCFLANFNPIEQQYVRKSEMNKYELVYPNGDSSISRGIDGGEFTVPVDSYFPYINGLYNMAGNVSEMIDEPGIVKGGSWNSSGTELFNGSIEKIDGVDPRVGFRYFMEIIEE